MNLFQEIKLQYWQTNHAVRRIIVVNVLVFLVISLLQVIIKLTEVDLGVTQLLSYLTLPANFDALLKKPWSIITYMFLHDGLLHIIMNMLWLHWIGNLLHEYLGNKRVYQAYFLGGILGAVIYMLAYNVFPFLMQYRYTMQAVGASAGVLSVIVATATLLKNYELQLLFLGPVKLKWIALAIVVLDVIGINAGNEGGHIAHLGGALFGFLFIRDLYTYTFIDKIFNNFGRLFGRKSPLKIYHKRQEPKGRHSARPSQDEVDEILEKINQSGYDSLTRREKETLNKASRD